MIQNTIQNWICDNCNVTVAPVDISRAKCPDNWQVLNVVDNSGFTTQYAICDNQQTCNKSNLVISSFPPKPLMKSSTTVK